MLLGQPIPYSSLGLVVPEILELVWGEAVDEHRGACEGNETEVQDRGAYRESTRPRRRGDVDSDTDSGVDREREGRIGSDLNPSNLDDGEIRVDEVVVVGEVVGEGEGEEVRGNDEGTTRVRARVSGFDDVLTAIIQYNAGTMLCCAVLTQY